MEIESEQRVEKSSCSTAGSATFIIGLVSGTFSALFCKMAYQTESIGLDGEPKLFTKPICMLMLMFMGMVPAIFFWLFQQFRLEPHQREVVSYQTMGVLIVPCLCDLVCTLLLLTAQVYITASMWQMLRGSVICITALLKRFLLNTRLRTHMWVGVAVITVAMLLVACTSLIQPASTDALSSGKDPRIGVVLVLMGCVAQGVQYVFEEKVMNVDNAPPLVVIGCEGLWGTVLTILIIYPIAYLMPGDDNGSFEDPWDALAMVQHSKTLKLFTIGFVGLVTIYNCMAVYVTKYLSAIWHAILDNFRPITIWATDLVIFYKIAPGSGFGESWNSASYMQLAGLIVLLFGVAVYDGAVYVWDEEYEKVPLRANDDIGAAGGAPAEKEIVLHGTPVMMASPALTRSPLIYNKDALKKTGSEDRNDGGTVTKYAATGTTKFDRQKGGKPRAGSDV